MTATLQISLDTPSLTSQQSWANDSKVAMTLLKYYQIRELGDAGLTNQEKLDLVLKDMAQHVITTVKTAEYDARRMASQAQHAGDVDTEFNFDAP